MRGVYEDSVSSDLKSLIRDCSYFSNYHTPRHLEDYNLYLPYCSRLQALETPFSVHPLCLHIYIIVAENKARFAELR